MRARLNRLWRLIATGGCFSVFGLGGLFLAVAVFPVVGIMHRDREKRTRAARKIVYHAFRLFVWLMKSSVLTLETVNVDRIAGRKGMLVVANHPTLIDVVLLMSIIPDINCVVKKALWSNLFLAGVVRYTGYISNGEPGIIVDDCVEWLKSGGSLIVFPEGSRTRVGQARTLQRGAANIAVRAGANLTPVTITCKPLFLNKESSWYKIPVRRPHFRLIFREDIDIGTIVASEQEYARSARRVTEYLNNFFDREVLADE